MNGGLAQTSRASNGGSSVALARSSRVFMPRLVQVAGRIVLTLRNAKLSVIKAHRIVVKLSAALGGLSTSCVLTKSLVFSAENMSPATSNLAALQCVKTRMESKVGRTNNVFISLSPEYDCR